jgi:hypothetical protein
VFLEIDLDPDKHARLGLAYARIAGRSDLGFEEIEQKVPPPFVLLREAFDPLRKTAESPTFLSQELCEKELTESSWLLSRVVGEFDQVPVEERRAGDGPETHPRGQDLGETIHPENTAVDVHGKKGGDKRTRKLFEKALVRGVGVLGTIKLEEVVWVWKPTGSESHPELELRLTIFKNDQVIPLSDGVDFLPPFQAERRTGGVLAATVGDGG